MTLEPQDTRWRARPVLAAAVRVLLLLVPLLASGLAVIAVDRAAPPSPDQPALWLALAMTAALVTGVAVERGVRRFLPLPVLLRLDLLFPGTAPSRYRVARDAVSRSQARLAATPSGTAEQVMRLIGALGAHDRRTRGHCERVRVLTDLLAAEMHLGQDDRDRLRWAALLHDLGKLEVPSAVLNKPSSLSAGEFATVRSHPEVGALLAAPLLPWLGEWGLGIVEHHEKYDGSGYPAGLAALSISRAGRMVGLVDAFETMTAARTYKKAMATAAARAELAACSGSQFDPVCVRAFLAVPLPRLLWAMGPTSFALQVPFLRMLAEAGRISASAGAAAGPAAAGVAGAAAIAITGLAAVPSAVSAGDAARPLVMGMPQQAQVMGPSVLARAVTSTVAVPIGPPTGITADLAPVEAPVEAPVAAPVVGPPTGLDPALPLPPSPLPVVPILGLPEAVAPAPVVVGPVVPGPDVVLEPELPVPAVDPLLPVLEPVIAPELVPVVVPVVDPVVDAVIPVVEPVVGPVVPVVGPGVDVVVPVVEPVIDPVVPVLEPVIDTVVPVLDPVLQTVEPVVGVLDPVVDVVDTALPLEPVLEPVLEPTTPVVDAIVSPLPIGGLLGG